jgi:hypothetical protein
MQWNWPFGQAGVPVALVGGTWMCTWFVRAIGTVAIVLVSGLSLEESVRHLLGRTE